MDDDLGWHPCPNCLGQLEPVDDGSAVVLTCPQCGFTGERLELPDLARPSSSDLPSFDGF